MSKKNMCWKFVVFKRQQTNLNDTLRQHGPVEVRSAIITDRETAYPKALEFVTMTEGRTRRFTAKRVELNGRC